MFFIKKLNFIRQWFFVAILKNVLPQKCLSRKTYFWRIFVNGNILKNWKPRFTFWKKREKKISDKTFCVCYFGQHVFPLRSIEAWNWSNADVSKKQTDYLLYWFSENVKNNWNQCISINICLATHKNVASQVKMLEFWLLDTLKIEKLKLNEKLNL